MLGLSSAQWTMLARVRLGRRSSALDESISARRTREPATTGQPPTTKPYVYTAKTTASVWLGVEHGDGDFAADDHVAGGDVPRYRDALEPQRQGSR